MANNAVNQELKVVPSSDLILLPGMEYTLALKSESLKILLSDDEKSAIILSLKQNFNQNSLTEADFYMVGTLVRVLDIIQKEQHSLLKIKAVDRVELTDLNFDAGAIWANYDIAPDIIDLDIKSQEEMLAYIKGLVREIGMNFKGSEPFIKAFDKEIDLNVLMGQLGQYLRISNAEKQGLIEIRSLKQRCLQFMDHLLKQKESIKLQFEMAERFSEKANKAQRETVLREHLKSIQEELNEGNSGNGTDGKDYRKRIESAGMPDEVLKTALEEVSKFESQNPSSPDYNIIRNYLDILVELPWREGESKEINLQEARRILDEQHYGLEKVKDRIIQHLAVMKLKKDKKGSIILLVGPPGTGKTSLGKSIAEALGRKYIRVSLGGIKDEAEIRGHRRTYIGALPGRIIQNMRKAGEKNPVFVLDEVDKLMTAYNGDPASALLEVLDPEQNNSFTDHYLEVPYDLSEVFFIATANSTENISGPLLDRMEIIPISSYTSNEKYHIAKDHLVAGVLEEHGLNNEMLVIEDETIKGIIADYTQEAGVRGLRKQIASIARVTSEKIVSNTVQTPYVVRPDMLEEILGNQISRHDVAQLDNPPGVATGLAWTPVGGEILFIEGTDMPGTGKLILTGKLGDVMKESAQISLSLVKSRLSISTLNFNFKERDLHIHVPSGAVSKDGPSAGIALFTAIASLITGIKVDSTLAMTGEITLRGAVLPIGGVKEKLLAAHRAGIKKVLIPKENMKDLKELPDEVKEQLIIKPVEIIEDVLREALGISLPKPEIVLRHGLIHDGQRNSSVL
ncbi:MAG: endopeptidase La [Firmicutes bacterium HGW-Firmicutes-15]|nr:MAG: endopeptidase La [Firmicutes bacterium HGW-Firmicutes-15]